MIKTFKTAFRDVNSGQEHLAIVENEPTGVSLAVPGFGTYDGGGAIAYLEFRNGVPHLIVWANIAEEMPTHVISLEKAGEEHRLPDDEPVALRPYQKPPEQPIMLAVAPPNSGKTFVVQAGTNIATWTKTGEVRVAVEVDGGKMLRTTFNDDGITHDLIEGTKVVASDKQPYERVVSRVEEVQELVTVLGG